jgi:hypothetical protein
MLSIFFSKIKSNIKFILILMVLITVSLNLFFRGKVIKNNLIKNGIEHTKISVEIISDDNKNITTNLRSNLIIPPKYFRNYSKPLSFELYSIDYRRENKMLPRGLSLNEYEKLMTLIEIIASILSKNNMEFFIGYGTQLGNYC